MSSRKSLPIKAFARFVAEEILEDIVNGGYGRVPCLRHASLIYDLGEEEIYKEVKKEQSKLQDPMASLSL
jgi:hypothetical protein